MYTTKGIIYEIFPPQTFSKGFKKREFILNVRRGEKIENIKFECHGDKVDLLDNLAQGDLIEIQFTITGREWQGRHFNNLVCFGIEYDQTDAQKEVINLTKEEQKEVDEEVPF